MAGALGRKSQSGQGGDRRMQRNLFIPCDQRFVSLVAEEVDAWNFSRRHMVSLRIIRERAGFQLA
jgi:hypothetical protein